MNTPKLPPLSKGESRIYNLLSKGGKYSVADLTISLHLCDPRHYIRALRKKGVKVLDDVQKTENGGRFKLYYLG